MISIVSEADGTVFKFLTITCKSRTSVSCANLIKMKTHSQFILINWNITSPKMVRNNILER